MGLKKILLVDDDLDFLALVVHFLKDNNYQVIPANDGEKAKEILDMHKLELVISDYKMPTTDGLELLKWSKERYQSLPFILITAFEKVEETQKAHKLGADSFILKPIKKNEFLQKIRDLLDRTESGPVPVSKDLSDMYSSVALKEYLSRRVNFPLYIKLTSSKYVKVANESAGLSKEMVKRYLSKGIRNFYMKKEDYRKLLVNTVDIANVVKGHAKVDPEKKKKFMIHASEMMITEVYSDGLDKDLFNEAKKYSETVLDSLVESADIMNILDSLNAKEGFMAHTLGVATFAVMVAEKMGLENAKTKVMLGMAGLFHDIGKKDLPAEILNKPDSQLTAEERKLVEEHPYKGATQLNELLNETDPELVQIIMQHHEYYDGSGYPFKLKRHKIFRMAQIVAVVNTFSNLILKSAEGGPMTPSQAIKIMEKDYSNKFDPEIFDALKKILL